MSKPVTIDNLGVDPSKRYARDVEGTDRKFFQDSSKVSQSTSVTVNSPFFSDLEELFGTLIKTPSWADFAPPPDFSSHVRSLFTHQLIPSLGSPEKLEQDIQLIDEKSAKNQEEQQNQSGQDSSEQEAHGKSEKEKILAMLQCVQKFDKILTLINARKGEFHKG